MKEIDAITEYIFMGPRLEKADLIMVFGTRHKEATEMAGKLYFEVMHEKYWSAA